MYDHLHSVISSLTTGTIDRRRSQQLHFHAGHHHRAGHCGEDPGGFARCHETAGTGSVLGPPASRPLLSACRSRSPSNDRDRRQPNSKEGYPRRRSLSPLTSLFSFIWSFKPRRGAHQQTFSHKQKNILGDACGLEEGIRRGRARIPAGADSD